MVLSEIKNSAINAVFPISQFMFPKYLIEFQKVKVVKSKFKSEKSNKHKHKSKVVLNKTKEKRH